MTFGSNVAPSRRVKEKPADWFCRCYTRETVNGHKNTLLARKPGYLVRCTDCGQHRPL